MTAGIKLRVAVTQSCNLFCQGCFNEWQSSRAAKYASVDVLVYNVKNIIEHISSIKLTGGEPLLHKDIGVIASKLSHIASVSITTNGLMLEKRICEIPNSIPITVSCYGINQNDFASYTQTNPKVYSIFIEQMKFVREEVNRDFSLNVIIGDSMHWQFYEYIDFAIKFGFKKIRFLTQLNNQLAANSYNINKDSLVGFMNALGASRAVDGDPSTFFSYIDDIKIELVRQYSEFDKAVQDKYGFVWIDYKGKAYNPIGNNVFNAKGFLHVKSI